MSQELESHLSNQQEARRQKMELIKAWTKRLAPAVLLLALRGEPEMVAPSSFDPSVEEAKKVCPSERHELGAAPWGEESKSDEYGCWIEVIREDDGLYHVYVGPGSANQNTSNSEK